MCLTLLGGGVSAESDMSDFWPDFFLQTAPKLACFLAGPPAEANPGTFQTCNKRTQVSIFLPGTK